MITNPERRGEAAKSKDIAPTSVNDDRASVYSTRSASSRTVRDNDRIRAPYQRDHWSRLYRDFTELDRHGRTAVRDDAKHSRTATARPLVTALQVSRVNAQTESVVTPH